MVPDRLFRTVERMEALVRHPGYEPPWMDSRRVLKSLSGTNAWEYKTELINTL